MSTLIVLSQNMIWFGLTFSNLMRSRSNLILMKQPSGSYTSSMYCETYRTKHLNSYSDILIPDSRLETSPRPHNIATLLEFMLLIDSLLALLASYTAFSCRHCPLHIMGSNFDAVTVYSNLTSPRSVFSILPLTTLAYSGSSSTSR